MSAWLFQEAARGVKDLAEPLFPGIFDKSGVIVGPTVAGAAGKPALAWSRPVRLLVWLAQWCTHNVFLIYAGTGFVIIGRDPHCPGAAFCGGGEPTVMQRIWAIYARLHFSCHIAGAALYALSLALAKKEKRGGKAAAGAGGDAKGASAVPESSKSK